MLVRPRMMSKYLSPKNDYAFKHLFGNEKHKDILIKFLNDCLDLGSHRIEDVAFLKPSQDPKIAYKKQSIVDVLCTDQHGHQYIVEMQVVKLPGFEKRAQYYAAKAYANQLDREEEYHKLKQIIFLAVTDFVMFPNKADYRSSHVILDNKTLEHDLKDFSFTFLELPKFTKQIDELENSFERWMYFLKHADETTNFDIKYMAEDTIIGQAYDALDKYNWTEDEFLAYEHDQKVDLDNKILHNHQLEQAQKTGLELGLQEGITKGLQQGIAQGIEQGIQEGIEKGIQLGIKQGIQAGIEEGRNAAVNETLSNIAQKMLDENAPLETIIKITGLQMQEIMRINPNK